MLANANMGDYKLKSSPDYEVGLRPFSDAMWIFFLASDVRLVTASCPTPPPSPLCTILPCTLSFSFLVSSAPNCPPTLLPLSPFPLANLSLWPGNTKVPEEMQLNVAKKQREMALLEDSVHAMRLKFNNRFLALRTIKREILATVAADNKRLRGIDAELGEGGNGQGRCGIVTRLDTHTSRGLRRGCYVVSPSLMPSIR